MYVKRLSAVHDLIWMVTIRIKACALTVNCTQLLGFIVFGRVSGSRWVGVAWSLGDLSGENNGQIHASIIEVPRRLSCTPDSVSRLVRKTVLVSLKSLPSLHVRLTFSF